MNNNNAALFNSHLSLSGFEEARSLTIVQSDDTTLEFILKDINLKPVILPQTTGLAQLVDSKRNSLVATFDVAIEGSKAVFSINKALPVSEYELYIKIGKQYFPSKEQSFILRVIEAYDVVDDIDLDDITTIDIVINALRDDVVEAIKGELEFYIDTVINTNPTRFKGEKGDKFTRADFTEADWASLKGQDATPLRPSQLDASELELIKGEKGDRGEQGDSLTWDDLTDEQKQLLKGKDGLSAYQLAVGHGFEGSESEYIESLKGKDGTNGLDGESFNFEALTPEQKEEIKGAKGEQGTKGSSAYEVAVQEGFEGTEVEWLNSLKGLDGTVEYDNLTPAQKRELHLPPRIYTREEYESLEEYDPNTLYFIVDTPIYEEETGE